MAYYARPPNESGAPQLLREHLQNVGLLAAEFCEAIGLDPRLGAWAGWLHDLGKYSDEFQRHRLCIEPDGTPIREPARKMVEHAAYGAAVALRFQREIAAVVAAHHAGLSADRELTHLPDRDEHIFQSPQPVSMRARQLLERAQRESAFPDLPSEGLSATGNRLSLELRTRMLLSCLVDADRLDAERWANRERHGLRSVPPLEPANRLPNVLQFIEQQRARALAAGTSADVLRVRAQVLEQSLEAAEQATGFFSLTVPTGGGKTLASLAFALRHAAEHDLRRVVVIAPFLAIIEQNADVIRTALGPSAEDLVLEHHSQADESRTNDEQSLAELRRQMLAENWDTPLVVTTAVQFFESLFSNRPGRVRKLHNIARSALIFDEAQTFPPGLLRPIVGMLEQLVAEYSCTVLFATATQPALAHPRLREPLLRNVMREIVADPGDLFGRLKRVEVDWSAATVGSSMDAVAGEMASEHQALAIVNTKQQARELFEALRRYDIDAEHLSGRMCPAHRLEVLARVRVSLENGQRCLVSSTSGLEAGVDISFPKVWRALAPFDSIAQAAGRCNREGRLQSGRLIVFEPEDGKTPQGVYETGRNVTRNLLRMQLSIDDPDSFALYFAHLYNMTSLDEHHVIRLREQLEFPAVAERVRLIAEDTVPVLVAFGEGLSMIDRFVKGEVHALDRYQRRRLERYSVSLYRPEFEQAKAAGFIYEAAGIWYAPSNYSPQLGLTFEDGILIE